MLKNERRRETIQALRVAVAQQSLSLCYQPIVDFERHRVYSVEALARWEHPQLGAVSPATFIPLAEETGLMVPLGSWVMQRACGEFRNLDAPKFQRVSVNVSVAQILDSRFMYCLYQALETSKIEPASANCCRKYGSSASAWRSTISARVIPRCPIWPACR
jgi:EAL domain-containing protein (putative c-di-GMP-specific phosphodiesterase class I)